VILALLACVEVPVDTSQPAAAYVGPVEISGAQVDCFSASWQIGLWAVGVPDAATVSLVPETDSAAPPAEVHPLTVQDRDPRGSWSRWGVDLAYGEDLPGLQTAIACPASWTLEAFDADGARVGCVGDPESAC
jgi:hypothetical protein